MGMWVWLVVGGLVSPLLAVMLGFCIAHLIDHCCDREHRVCHCTCCIQEYEYF